MNTWRFLDSGPSTAVMNMAIDQALLTTHANGECLPTFRIISVGPSGDFTGIFPKTPRAKPGGLPEMGIDVIRRPTGGRAVLHFGDLTYSIVAGTNDGIPPSVTAAYRLLCEGLLSAFRILGFEAQMRNPLGKSPPSDNCFLTSTAGDLIYEEKKFVGSAQTWKKSSVLQHGSIILEPHFEVWEYIEADRHILPTDYKKSLEQGMTSIKEILGHIPSNNEINSAIRKGLTQVLGIEFEKGELSQAELTLAKENASHYVEKDLVPVYQPAGIIE